MKTLEKWMVGLDFTAFDNHLISYTHHLAEVYQPKEVVFVHIKHRIEIPDRMRFGIKEVMSREEVKKAMEEKVFKVFKEGGTARCEVHEGTATFDLWRESFLHHTDLIILGEKDNPDGNKVVPENFVRKSFCSVLFVPENSKVNFKKVWVPVDFSDRSQDALDLALEVDETKGREVHLHHIYEVPSMDLVQKELLDEYKSYFREKAQEKMQHLINGSKKPKVHEHYSILDHGRVSTIIKEEAEANGADLIIASSGGKSLLSVLFLGSTTYQLVRDEKKIPTLILKTKKDKIRSWEILTNL